MQMFADGLNMYARMLVAAGDEAVFRACIADGGEGKAAVGHEGIAGRISRMVKQTLTSSAQHSTTQYGMVQDVTTGKWLARGHARTAVGHNAVADTVV
jgi:hypothetical protein